MSETIGKKLREAREAHQMNLNEGAKHVGLSSSGFLSDIERGKAAFSNKTIQKFLKAYPNHIRAEDFFPQEDCV